MSHDTAPSPFIAALAQQREAVAQRAAAILASREFLEWEGSAGLQELLGLLAASLEELKVVEEEMLLQHEGFTESWAEVERQSSYHQLVFKHTPVALLVTDSLGTIRDANAAASTLLRRSSDHLVGKPLAALVPREMRSEFRTALNRLPLTTLVNDWRLGLLRPTDAPIHVALAAQMAPRLFDGLPGIVWTVRASADDALSAPALQSQASDEARAIR